MNYFLKLISGFAVTFFLVSCSLSPVKVEPQSAYIISPTLPAAKKTYTRPIVLLVMPPQINSIYNTTSMAYKLYPYQIAYFGKNVWVETPAQMLQPLIIQALQNTNYFQAIVTPPFESRYDYILNVSINELLQDFTLHPSRLKLKVRAQIINTKSNRVIATKQFFIQQPMQKNTPYAGVIAANQATAKLVYQLAEFCVENIRR